MPLALALARTHTEISAALCADTQKGNLVVIQQYTGPPSFALLRKEVLGWGQSTRLSGMRFESMRGPFNREEFSTYGLVITEDLADDAYASPLSTPKPTDLLPLTIERFRPEVAIIDRFTRQGQIEVVARKDYPAALNTLAQCLADGRMRGIETDSLTKDLRAVEISKDSLFGVKDTKVLAVAIAIQVLTDQEGFVMGKDEAERAIKSLTEIAGSLEALAGNQEVKVFEGLTGISVEQDLMGFWEG